MMALQELTEVTSPDSSLVPLIHPLIYLVNTFDEINQRMDERMNKRAVWGMLLEVCNDAVFLGIVTVQLTLLLKILQCFVMVLHVSICGGDRIVQQ